MKSKIFIAMVLLSFMAFCQAAEILMTFQRQSGGRTGESSMTTTDGTLWQSNASVYSNSNYYYMEYMFDRLHDAAGWGTGWLTNSGGSDKWLTITFSEARYITKIRSYTIMHPGYRSDAHVSTSADGSNFTQRGDVLTGSHYNDTDYYNYYVDVYVNAFVKTVRYDLFNNTYNGCAVITEVEMYTQNVPVPEPSYLFFLGFALLWIARRKA